MIQAVIHGAHLSFTVFFPSLLDLAGGQRARLSAAYTLFTLVYTTLMFPVGLVADRWSPRRLLAASTVAYAAGFALSALARSVTDLFLTFGLLARLGMSAGYLVPTTTTYRWLPHRGGLAVGIASAGVGLANLAVPPTAFWLIERLGWRAAFATLGAGILASVLLASLALRSSPTGGTGAGGLASAPLSTRIIVRAPQFWLLGLVCATSWLPVFALWARLFPMALARGLPPAAAAGVVAAFGVASLAGRLVWGPFSDRRGRPLSLALCLAGQALAMGLLAVRPGAHAFLVAVSLFGFVSGGVMVLVAVFAGDLFGRASTGCVVGAPRPLAASSPRSGPWRRASSTTPQAPIGRRSGSAYCSARRHWGCTPGSSAASHTTDRQQGDDGRAVSRGGEPTLPGASRRSGRPAAPVERDVLDTASNRSPPRGRSSVLAAADVRCDAMWRPPGPPGQRRRSRRRAPTDDGRSCASSRSDFRVRAVHASARIFALATRGRTRGT